MKIRTVLFLLLTISLIQARGQDTFSIVAIDPETGEIGGAGASCIDESAIAGGVLIINDIIPGRGAIHTQAYWNPTNQQHAHDRMMEGFSPQQIIDWLVTNDVQNNPSIRQYGIVDMSPFNTPRSAGYTGVNCDDYKNHIAGPNYAIQGNILLGQQILDSIEARFLSTEGTLAEKLMSALQGANVPGADTRCLSEGTSSLSAFVRVARPQDTTGTFWCDLLVPSTPYGVEPIDSLQALFDQWLIWTGTHHEAFEQPNRLKLYPNPASSRLTIEVNKKQVNGALRIQIVSMTGALIRELKYYDEPIHLNTVEYEPGIYVCKILCKNRILDASRFNIVK